MIPDTPELKQHLCCEQLMQGLTEAHVVSVVTTCGRQGLRALTDKQLKGQKSLKHLSGD